MVVGDAAAGFPRMPSFRPSARASDGSHGAATMKSFVDGIMSPLVSCWQPPMNSCVPGCVAPPGSSRFGSDPPSVVSPMVERQPPNPYHSHPTSPRSKPPPPTPTSYHHHRRYHGTEIPTNVPPSPATKSSTQPLTDIEKPHSNDVLCGRGGSSNRHLGNMHFRELVAANKKTYVGLTKKQKMLVARKIVEMVHHTEPPGRFLAKDLETGLWYDIGLPRSLEKTSQALREKNSNDVPETQNSGSEAPSHDGSHPTAEVPKKEESSATATTSSSKSKNSKNVEAPPITIPAHLREIFGPRKQQHPPQKGPRHPPGAWPEYAPSSSAPRHMEQPYGGSYSATPGSPTGPSSSDPYRHHMATPSRHSHHRYGDVTPPSSSPSSYHNIPDHREHYEHYHASHPDRRDHYVTPSRPMDHISGGSSRSARLPPPPPPGHSHHHRGHPPPQVPPSHHRHPPPNYGRHPHGPPPGHHRPPSGHPPPSHFQHRGHAASPTPHHHMSSAASSVASPRSIQSSAPTSPISSASSATGSHDYDYDYYHHHQHHIASSHYHHHSAQAPPSSSGYSGAHHHSSYVDRSSPAVRSKSEVSPERRQEWKRQRNAEGSVRRLSEASLSRAMEHRLSLEEHAGVNRDHHHRHYHSHQVESSHPERVVMGHRELLQHHRAQTAGTAALVNPPSSSRGQDLPSPSGVLQSRSRRGPPITDLTREPDTAAGVGTAGADSKSDTRDSTEVASNSRLAGLAALSTAAFLKLDESK